MESNAPELLSSSLLARIRQLPAMAGVRVSRHLAGGVCSDKWLLEANGSKYVLRHDGVAAQTLGLDRHSELGLLRTLASAGFVRAPVWADAEAGLLLLAYETGAVWQVQDFHRPERLTALGQSLQRLHSLPVSGPVLDLRARLRHYAGLANCPEANILQKATLRLLDELDYCAEPLAICHNDAVVGNILGKNPLQLIDWEYAAAGNPRFELAVVAGHHELNEGAVAHLLGAYNSDVKQMVITLSELVSWRRVYAGVRNLWLLAAANLAEDVPASRFATLRQRD